MIDSSNSTIGYGVSTQNIATIGLLLVASVLRGNVTIALADTSVLPVVSPNWLLENLEQKIAVLTCERARTIFAAFAAQSITTGPEVSPAVDVQTDAEF